MSFDIDLDLEKRIARKPGVKAAIVRETKERAELGETLLTIARATTPHEKFAWEHAHEAKVTADFGRVDGFIVLHGGEGTSAKSIEYGHLPSGVFGPDGMYGHIPSKAPEGLYILHRAAGLL